MLWRSARTGVSVPWNLFLSVLVGLSLMAAPALFGLQGASRDSDPIAGALSIVVSVVAMAEGLRSARHLNSLFGLWMLVQLFWLDGGFAAALYHAIATILLILLSFRKGPVLEKSG